MIEELIAAATIGASLGNSWICALLSLGYSIYSKKGGVAFVMGRFLGLILLGSAIAGLGLMGNINPTFFLIIFGMLTVALGSFIILQILTRRSWKEHGHPLLRFLHRKKHAGKFEKDVMADGGEYNLDTESRPKVAYAFSLGVIRGATPCAKIMVLAPLLISVDFNLAIIMVLVFAITSTIYPIIGFLSGNLLRQSKKCTFYIRFGAAIMMIVIGVYFIVNAFVSTHGG